MSVKNKKGTMLLRSDEKLERWREHFEELLVNINSAVGTHTIDSISIPNISTLEIQRQDKIPTLEEIQLALSQMKSKKAPGNDGITVDILKAGGTPVLIWLKELFVEMWGNERIPENWSSAILIPLFKNKGDKTSCDNYRGICLLNVVSKLFTRVILNRIQIMIDQQLLEQQAGFRSNRSTVDQIFIVNMIMEKASEYDIPLFICFIDIQKAYDSVNRELLWKICRHYGLTDKIVKLLQLVYKDSNARIKINGDLSECFKMDTGVMQGGIPSPFLFNIVFDFIMKKVLSETKIAGVQLSYGKNDFCHGRKEKYENFEVLSLMYADDLVTICNSREHIETFIQVFERITQEYGLTMNVNKTCIMSSVQSKNNVNGKTIKNQQAEDVQVDIIIRNQKIETTQSFTYLGSLISNDHKADKEIKTRITKATTAFNSFRQLVWYKKRISILAKLCILRACVLPVLIYASEGWCLTKVQEDKISVFYMKCIRTILGLNLGDHVSNSAVLNLSGQPSVENIMRRNRLRWFGHVNRMEKEIGKPSLTKKSYVFLSLGPSTTEACRNQKKMGI
ncbi:unnamed protein product [Rotaria magnacalcarata]|uniref:Reverse transcriptase domain-containing protein n=2 Tax=Rotaria magnacalcarata TaxID=392030 RepID=A0A815ZQ38_9BILA|nr:unnamed protein product [Rotaria magnacalcarata]